jgi:hypothetical protein
MQFFIYAQCAAISNPKLAHSISPLSKINALASDTYAADDAHCRQIR